MTVAVMNAMVRPLVEARLPGWVEPRWFQSTQEMLAMAQHAEIGWFDTYSKPDMAMAVERAERLRWLNSIYAGVDGMPLDLLRARGVQYTNGVGINAVTIAEYVAMGMLVVAKGYDDVVRAADRHEWLLDSPGKVELEGSRALVLGAGAIGQRVLRILAGFGVEAVAVRRTPQPGALGPDEWRAQLGSFDWVILCVPATAETTGMIGADELASMKPSATLINIARGEVVDQDALIAALRERRLAHAFLDVTTPEPLPADHPLWDVPNAHITMHLSGRAQSRMVQRSADRFIENLGRFERGEPLEPLVDLSLGY